MTEILICNNPDTNCGEAWEGCNHRNPHKFDDAQCHIEHCSGREVACVPATDVEIAAARLRGVRIDG